MDIRIYEINEFYGVLENILNKFLSTSMLLTNIDNSKTLSDIILSRAEKITIKASHTTKYKKNIKSVNVKQAIKNIKYEIDKDKIYVTFEFETNKPIIKFDKYKKKISLSSSVYARIDNLWYFIQLNKQKLQFNLVEFLKKSHKIDKKLTLEYEIIANCLTRIMTAYNEYIDKRIDIGYRTEEDSKYYYIYINENDKTIEIQLDYKGAEIQNIMEEEIKLNYQLFSKHMEKINFDNIILAKIDLIEHESMIKDFIKQIIDKINENSGIWIYYDINFDNKICTLNIGITTETMNLSMPILIVPVLDNIIL